MRRNQVQSAARMAERPFVGERALAKEENSGEEQIGTSRQKVFAILSEQRNRKCHCEASRANEQECLCRCAERTLPVSSSSRHRLAPIGEMAFNVLIRHERLHRSGGAWCGARNCPERADSAQSVPLLMLIHSKFSIKLASKLPY